MLNQRIENINSFISGIENQDEADFYTDICDYFDFKKLGNIFELNELIEAFRDSIDVLKRYGSNYDRTVVFIKNLVETRKFNAVQKYNFYLLFHIFFDYLVFENIKPNAEKYLSWIGDQIYFVNDIATMYYIDFNISNLAKEIADKSVNEQIRILLAQKSEYLLALSQHNIPANNFDQHCDQQIQVLQQRREEEQVGGIQEKSAQITVPNDETLVETVGNTPELTLPDVLLKKKFGDVHFAAEHTGYSVSTIRRLARTQKIPAHKPTKTGEWRFFAEELDDWKLNGMKNFPLQSDDSTLGKHKRRKKYGE